MPCHDIRTYTFKNKKKDKSLTKSLHIWRISIQHIMNVYISGWNKCNKSLKKKSLNGGCMYITDVFGRKTWRKRSVQTEERHDEEGTHE